MKGELAVGATVGNVYVLAREIATGAMGSVFEADAPDGRRVAVKTLLSTRGKKDGPERRERFLREAALSATLVHPHIVEVLAHGVDAATDTPYLVMPLLRGEDLARAIDRLGALDPAACVPLFVQACRGLDFAHRAGVVHRDVKPSNLFLETEADGSVVVRVADFGLAKVFDASVKSLTASGRFMGTPHYVSPEQATNAKRVDVRSDVWSFAMSLYHALAGVPAFAKTRSFMQLVLELTGPAGVRPLQDAAPWIDPRIARVVHGALVADIDLRCPSIGELSLALTTAVGIDVAEKRLTMADVRAASDATKATTAERAELPASWDELLRFG